MDRVLKSLLLGAAVLVAGQAAAYDYFTDPFDVNPVITGDQTAVPNAWFWDRYRPDHFDSEVFLGDNRLHIGISSNDGFGPNATGGGRPPAYASTFYNTQGRQYLLGNGYYTSIKGKLYVGSDWSTNRRRSDIWGVAVNGANSVVGYPIIGIANIDASTIVCRVFTQDTDQNPNTPLDGGWVDVSASVPGGLTTNRWYSLEVRLKPGVYEFLVDGKLVFSDQFTYSVLQTNQAVAFGAMIMQAYNFNDPTLAPINQSFQDSYDVYWDDVTAGPFPLQGFPVDLNGSYRSPSSGPLGPSQSGIAVAATFPFGFGNVFERNGVNAVADNAVNGSFTPYNDTTKLPNFLALATANDGDGTTFEADIDLSGTWKPFEWGGSPPNFPPFATGDTFAVGMMNSFNSFGVQFVTDLAGFFKARISSTKLSSGSLGVLETNGTPATFPAGTTRVRVNASVSAGLLTATVMPLDGPDAYVVSPLGSTNGLNLDTNSPWLITYTSIGFVAGFETHEHVSAAANATVSNFSTNAVPNAMYLFTDDPYVRSVDPNIAYRAGQANLLQLITGYQAFMLAGGGQTFASGTYVGPYTTFFPPVITTLLNASAAGVSPNQANVSFVDFLYTPGGAEVATGMGYRPNAGTENNLFAGGPPLYSDFLSNAFGSNIVVIDNTAPTLSPITLGGTAYSPPNVIVGTLNITIDATDLGAQQSGLDGRPAGQVTWSNATTTPLSTVSIIGNTFRTSIPITLSTPSGPATISLSVTDRAGNTTNQVLAITVSTVNVTLTLIEKGVDANVNRVVDIMVGSTGGPTAPIMVRKLVAFNVFTNAPGPNSRQGTVLITYQDLDLADNALVDYSVPSTAALTLFWAKDPFFSLGKQAALAGSFGSFTGSATLTMGDLTNNNVVNVSDIAVWAANNGLVMNPNTTLVQPPTPRQANVDGVGNVDLGDRNLIIAAWLLAGDVNLVGNFRDGGGGQRRDGMQRISAVQKETGLSLRLLQSMDSNRDDWLTRIEVLRWVR